MALLPSEAFFFLPFFFFLFFPPPPNSCVFNLCQSESQSESRSAGGSHFFDFFFFPFLFSITHGRQTAGGRKKLYLVEIQRTSPDTPRHPFFSFLFRWLGLSGGRSKTIPTPILRSALSFGSPAFFYSFPFFFSLGENQKRRKGGGGQL